MTGPVPTPASRNPPPTVVVLGAGIAGLTAAHELVERGFVVTVVEAQADERTVVGDLPPEAYPPVKLGGLAASQYSTCDQAPAAGHFRLRPFPGRRGVPRLPRCAVAGEHGFRFFPAYYLHIWDLLQRIPVYVCLPGTPLRWQRASRTVMDNVQRVVTQATTLTGRPSLIFPREAPRSLAELLTTAGQLGEFSATPDDGANLVARILKYVLTSPLRRSTELQNLSAYDYFIGHDATAARQFVYSPQFEALLQDMPKVLVALDSRWGDARTNISTYLQLVLRTDRDDDKADGSLNGPTTEAWFDNWYRHLVELGVRFVRARVDRIDPPTVDRRVPPHLRPGVQVVLADGTRPTADYVVCAVDATAAECITIPLRQAGTGGTVLDLDGFTTSVAPPADALQPRDTRLPGRRDPFAMDAVGKQPWDRFQTLAGIQFFFDTEFQLVRGHVYYSGTDWGLSAINQQGLWENRPILGRDGYVSRLSVDIGDFNTPSRYLVDEQGQGKAARDCTADEIAAEVWRQLAVALTNVPQPPEAVLPWPVWYTLDRNLVFSAPDGGGRPVRNEAPYLVPIVGDWPNRPGADPWNPNGSSWTTRTTAEGWVEDLQLRAVWQARHGGYQVHHNSLVFAGTWTKTFTRLTTMEAACESARHAVNAILDHYVWGATAGADTREGQSLDWLIPADFLDQGLIPVRQPTPAGDYCFVFDMENREPFDARFLRNLDSDSVRAGLPHPLDLMDTLSVTSPPSGGPQMTSPPNDYTGRLLTYLQAWRQYLEQTASGLGAGQTWPTPPWPGGATPPLPALPTPPGAPLPATPPPWPVATPTPSSTTTPTWPLTPAPAGPPLPPVAAPPASSPAPGPAPAGPATTWATGGAAGSGPPNADPPYDQSSSPANPVTGSAFPWAVETSTSPAPPSRSLYRMQDSEPPSAAIAFPLDSGDGGTPDVVGGAISQLGPIGRRPSLDWVPPRRDNVFQDFPVDVSNFLPVSPPPGPAPAPQDGRARITRGPSGIGIEADGPDPARPNPGRGTVQPPAPPPPLRPPVPGTGAPPRTQGPPVEIMGSDPQV